MVPKLFIQPVSCPSCAYPNNASFCFCQSCGYTRKVLVDASTSSSSVTLDVLLSMTAYHRLPAFPQKFYLQKELKLFLSSLPFSWNISTATPYELCRFLVWKDRKGKTKIHKPTCPFLHGTNLLHVLAQRALPMGQWTP